MGKKVELSLGRGTIYLGLILCAMISLTPLLWLVAASFKGPDDLFHYTFFAPAPVPV